MPHLGTLVAFGLLLCGQMASSLYVNLGLLPTSTVVKPLVSENVTMRCTLTASQYNRYNGYNRASSEEIVKIRMLRKPYDPMMNSANWQVMAQLSDTDSDVLVEVHTIQSEGVIYPKSDPRTSYLSVTWPLAVAETLGTFICDCLYLENEQTAQLKRSSQLAIGTSLKAEDFARIIHVEKAKAVEEMKAYKESIDKSLRELKQNVSEVMKTQNQTIAHLQMKLQGVLDSGFLLFWPSGSYGLLAPQSGCPIDGANQWLEGTIRHHTESTQRNTDEVSSPSHLKTPVLSRENAENFVSQHFCMKTSASVVGPKWPAGSYCINKKGSCPAGFQDGFVVFDEENDTPLTSHSGELPDGVYTNDTKMFFCCRSDGPANHQIHLPTDVPFYLYRHGGSCQRVFGMNVTAEFLIMDTENDNNHDEIQGLGLPDMQINNIVLQLCYYEAK